ncbi:MAG: helix-turn-helix transcriptional regulator [Agathobacter sp.]|nr:helix-turn-helix transcriptional regulator [Agathobacter sp.]
MSRSKPRKFNNTDKYYEISANIIRYRKLAGLTQGELAERVDVTQPYMSKIESLNNATMCTLEVLFDIADVLGVPAYKLLRPAED